MPRALLALTLCSMSSCATTDFTRATLEVHTFNRDSTNVHVVKSGESAFMVDSGYEKNAEALAADLKAKGIDPAKLKAIVVTHAHADHAGGARYFHEKYGTPVIVGEGDTAMLANGKNEKLCAVGFLANSRHAEDQSATYTPYKADVIVTSTQKLDELVGFEATVTLVASHTSGSLVVTAGDVVLVGDLLRGSVVGSGAETHLYMCDLEENKRAVARVLAEVAPTAKIVFVGHFGPVTRESTAEHFGVAIK